jgi:hypothetical protein
LLRFTHRFINFVAVLLRHQHRVSKVASSTAKHLTHHAKEIIMNTINKDNAGSIVLLAGMFFAIAAAVLSASDANAANTSAAVATPISQTAAHHASIDTIVVTATRLK